MGDYNSGALPDPCYRMSTGDGSRWRSIEFGDGTGYVRLDIARRWGDDGLDQREYVVGTFEPIDVEDRAEPNVVAYLKDNGLMDIVILSTVSMMRDWYDDNYGDAAHEFLREALKRHVGEEKLEELES